MNNKILILIIIVLMIIAVLIKPKENIEDNNKEIRVLLDGQDMSFNDYLTGVVGCEMPASFNYEAIKAQAIASRTFALNYIDNNTIKITSKAQCYSNSPTLKEKWKDNYDKYLNIIKSSILDTNNLVITYNNSLIKSYYFAISNGKTATAKSVFNEELPYLDSVDTSFDQNVNKFEVTNNYSYENFCKLLNISPCNINISNIIRDDSNRILSLYINNILYEGTTLRKILSLRSTDFEIKCLDDQIEITTKGYGHGVGMSQYGANYLASIGYNYQEILKYFYKDIEINKYIV